MTTESAIQITILVVFITLVISMTSFAVLNIFKLEEEITNCKQALFTDDWTKR